jgi:hypothetical protein
MKPTSAAGRSADCLSDLRIDMWLAHDLAAADEQKARGHVDGCEACATRLAQIEAERAAHAGAPGLGAIHAAAASRAAPLRARRRGWRLWSPLAVAGLAVGAAALVLVVPRDTGQVRTKGSARLGFFVKHDEQVRKGGPDELVHPGDLVRFTYSTAEPLHVAIVGSDAAGQASVYFPTDGATRALPAGHDVELPRSTLLDGTLGSEVVYALFCRQAIDLESVRLSVQADPTQPPAVSGCQADRLAWVKVRAP